jgi:small conductance mechanosensitive channel
MLTFLTLTESKPFELIDFQHWWADFYPKGIEFGIKLLISIILYFIGKKVIKIILKIARRAFIKGKTEVSAVNFICSLLKALLYGLLFIGIFYWFGVPEASFIALIGSVGLTIGLALQGSLSNFAGGVLILILKPFRIGDYIVANGKEGTVTSIDIIYTKVLTFDNKTIIFPNGTLANADIVNVTNEPVRRLDLIIPIGYSDDIRTVKEELFKICQRNEKILLERPVDLFVANYGNIAVEISLRVWTNKDDYFLVRSVLLESIKYMFDEKGFTIPIHQLDINTTNS